MQFRAARKHKGVSEAIKDTIGVNGGELSTFSAEDLKAVEKYRKMLKMRIPLEAVEHKMTSDGANKRIMDAVLKSISSNVHSTLNADGLTSEEEQIAEKYRKMLIVGLTKEAVEHKMTQD